MYNTEYDAQVDEARQRLFGNTGQPPPLGSRYMGVYRVVCCHRDGNGEYIPNTKIWHYALTLRDDVIRWLRRGVRRKNPAGL